MVAMMKLQSVMVMNASTSPARHRQSPGAATMNTLAEGNGL
jgi:hypothetical protein